ncbi:hypothetical protein B0H34DRAFT_822447 [Crassisporium funariophilum]|nr:hypothetical protein B0H34DRAFT_822447 [Crassisporium funariophilum]
MKTFYTFAIALFGLLSTSLTTFVSGVVIPNADTPLFYLVASSSSSSANLLPL